MAEQVRFEDVVEAATRGVLRALEVRNQEQGSSALLRNPHIIIGIIAEEAELRAVAAGGQQNA